MAWLNPKLPKALRPRWETPDPRGVAGSYGPEVIAWAEDNLGLTLGPWQRYVAIKMLRHDKDWRLIHRTALFSTGRQNGKSVIVRSFFGWLLAEGRCRYPFNSWVDIRAAAHDGKQARIIYRSVHDDLARLSIAKRPERLRGERAEQPPVRLSRWLGIETDTMTFDTITGEAGSARGLSIGALAFDEVLTQRDFSMWEAVKPTQNAQISPILILTSTAGMADSVVLRQYYERLKREASGDEKPDPSFYGVWWESQDAEAGLDWRQIRQANPAFGDGRLSKAGILDEYRTFPDDSWRRERLNHFVDAKADGAFNPGVWAACRTADPLEGLTGPYALAVDVQPGWQRATISVSGIRPDGRVGVQVLNDLRDEPGNPVTAARIIAALEAFPDYVAVILFDGISGASAELRRRGLETGLPYQELNRGQFVEACMDVTEMIHSGRLAVDDPLLDAQLPMVARRDVGADGAFCFSRGNSLGPIDAFLSMTFAAHGIASMIGNPRVL